MVVLLWEWLQNGGLGVGGSRRQSVDFDRKIRLVWVKWLSKAVSRPFLSVEMTQPNALKLTGLVFSDTGLDDFGVSSCV